MSLKILTWVTDSISNDDNQYAKHFFLLSYSNLFIFLFISTKWNAVSSKIWTQVTDSISYDDKHYAKHVSFFLLLFLLNHFHFTEGISAKYTQTNSSRIWTQVTDSISFDYNGYA